MKTLLVTACLSFPAFAHAAPVVAKTCSEALVLRGDQTGVRIRIADDYLPARWESAVSIYAEGRPRFVVPRGIHVRADGDGWWEVFRVDEPRVFAWTGLAGDKRWENPGNWEVADTGGKRSASGIPGQNDTVRFAKDAVVKLERDVAVSNFIFSAKVAMSRAIHARNTLGRGRSAVFLVRESSSLGTTQLKDGAALKPFSTIPAYGAEIAPDLPDGFTRTRLFRPAVEYVWTGGGKDGKWWNLANWEVRGKRPVELPYGGDRVVIPPRRDKSNRQPLDIELPGGVTSVSNLVMGTQVRWNKDAGRGFLDVWDLSGNNQFVVIGNVQFCAKGPDSTRVPIVATKGTVLACDRHAHRRYVDVTLEDGAALAPFEWIVEFEKLVLKPGHELHFGPPRMFNRWRPMWVMHAMHLEGEPNYPKIPGWRSQTDKQGDGSVLMGIHWGE